MDNQLVVILGQKGHGKTLLARRIFQREARVIAHDTTKRGFGGGIVVRTAEELRELMAEVKDRKFFKVIVRPDNKATTTACFALCKHVLNLTLIVDEADRFCTPQQTDPHLQHLINEGRHDGINLVLIARRPHRLHQDIWQADCVVAHRIQGPHDRQTLAQFFGPETDLLNLRPLEWRKYRDSPLLTF